MSAPVHQIAEELIAAADYRGLGQIAGLLGLEESAARSVRQLCEFMCEIIELDAEDWGDLPRFDPELAEIAVGALVPRDPRSKRRGFLQDLRPAFGLLQDVLAVRFAQHDLSGVLLVCHVMGEYLPLLAWQHNIGHAGDPPRLAEHVTRPGSRWGMAAEDPNSRDCDHPPGVRGSLRTAVRMGRPDRSWSTEDYRRLWSDYLDRDHSRVSSALATCGLKDRDGRPRTLRACDKPCTVWTKTPGDLEDLADRLALVGVYVESPLVRLRHSAPVGHGFGVPEVAQLSDAWQRTWSQLTTAWSARPNPLANAPIGTTDADEPLAGLGRFIDAVAGVPVPRPGLRTLVDTRLRLLVGR